MANRRERPDRLDGESVEQLQRSRGWKVMQARITKLHTQKMRELARPQAEIETASLRGFIAALETVLKIPSILEQEAKEAYADEFQGRSKEDRR